MGIVQRLVMAGLETAGQTSSVSSYPPLFVAVIFMLLSFIPVYFRLKNIGMNTLWCLAMLVPILNILLGFRCLAMQEGYADIKKLDVTGKVITVIILGFFAVMLVSLYVVFKVMPRPVMH